MTNHTAPLFLDQRQTGLAHCPLFKRALDFLSQQDRLARTAARTVVLALYKGEDQRDSSGGLYTSRTPSLRPPLRPLMHSRRARGVPRVSLPPCS